jgi:glycerate 2-kinase
MTGMRILVAPQEFKGTLTAIDAAEAIAEGARAAFRTAEVEVAPMADGGPGTVQALVAATGGSICTTNVSDPLGRPISAEWGLLPDGAAVIEMASAAGLTLLQGSERDPRVTTTSGVGELITAALDGGSGELIIGLGGSATNDGGAGMAQALGVRLLDADGGDLPGGGAPLARLARIDVSGIDARALDALVLAATDVRNPLCGPEGASLVYGLQKGASATVAEELDRALAHYAEVIERDLGVSVSDVPGAGAAGGLGAGLIAFLAALIRPGFQLIAERVGLDHRVRSADLVVTGEGSLDGQSTYGKTTAGVAEIARDQDVPVVAVCGQLGPGWEEVRALFSHIESVQAHDAPRGSHITDPAGLLARAAERAIKHWIETTVG